MKKSKFDQLYGMITESFYNDFGKGNYEKMPPKKWEAITDQLVQITKIDGRDVSAEMNGAEVVYTGGDLMVSVSFNKDDFAMHVVVNGKEKDIPGAEILQMRENTVELNAVLDSIVEDLG